MSNENQLDYSYITKNVGVYAIEDNGIYIITIKCSKYNDKNLSLWYNEKQNQITTLHEDSWGSYMFKRVDKIFKYGLE